MKLFAFFTRLFKREWAARYTLLRSDLEACAEKCSTEEAVEEPQVLTAIDERNMWIRSDVSL